MFKSNLIEILNSLDPNEIKEFGHFVRSPFFNRNQGLIRLYEYLKKVYPDFPENKLDKKLVYRQVFDKAEYNDGFMRVLISNLSKLLEEFLTYKNFINQRARQKLSLMNEFNLRRLEKEFKSAQKDAEKVIELIPKTDMWYYHYKALFEDNNYYFNLWSRNSKKKDRLSQEMGLKAIMDNFSRFYLIASLTMYRKVLHLNTNNKVNVDLKFTEEILKLLEKSADDFKDTPIINLHINEILLFTKGDRKFFYSLKDILLNEKGEYTYVELYSLHNIIQAFASKQVLRGSLYFEKEKTLLYKLADSKKILIYPFQNDIDSNLFLSAVNNAISAGEISWAEKFIGDYKDNLHENFRKIITDLCMAKICYVKNDIYEAQNLLHDIKTKNHDILINIKTLQLKIHYDTSQYIEAGLVTDSFKHLLSKIENTAAPVFYESYKNFIKYYSMLIRAKEKMKSYGAFELSDILKKNKTTQEYHWLKKKAKELLNL